MLWLVLLLLDESGIEEEGIVNHLQLLKMNDAQRRERGHLFMQKRGDYIIE